MRMLVVFYSKTGNTAKVAEKIKAFFEEKKVSVALHALQPVKNLKPKKLVKLEKVPLKPVPFSLKEFDCIFLGSPVWGFKANPVAVSFLKGLENLQGKKFVLFLTCHGFTGSSIKKMSSILATKGAVVIDSFAIKSVFSSFGEKQAEKALDYCEKIFLKMQSTK